LIKEDFPDDPQATYYLALARAQDGDTEGAIAELTALRDRSPMGAPWLPAVNGLLGEIAPDTATTPSDEDRRFEGPSADQMDAVQQMTPEQQIQMIEGMVAGLAQRLEDNPDDIEGWRRLARAYEVMGREADAEQAHREVIARDPDDPAANAFLSGQ
ncbi:MAG: tetratricopeptide repeat protein, partial [Pseudomonadota bacterium]